ncbi:MAG: hypothetical protein H0W15_04075 [Gemmatimonadales bacterium]|nr:hypothetical protein [Gemmatimonadales bacterium]
MFSPQLGFETAGLFSSAGCVQQAPYTAGFHEHWPDWQLNAAQAFTASAKLGMGTLVAMVSTSSLHPTRNMTTIAQVHCARCSIISFRS